MLKFGCRWSSLRDHLYCRRLLLLELGVRKIDLLTVTVVEYHPLWDETDLADFDNPDHVLI